MSAAAKQETAERPAQAANIRVVLGKVGLDGHDRGVMVIARALRDAGMEVIYTGLRRSPQELAAIAMQEDADVVGLSLLSGGVVPLTEAVLEELARQSMDDTVVFVGGIVGPEAEERLAELGVRGVFGPGTNMDDVVASIREQVDEARGRAS